MGRLNVSIFGMLLFFISCSGNPLHAKADFTSDFELKFKSIAAQYLSAMGKKVFIFGEGNILESERYASYFSVVEMISKDALAVAADLAKETLKEDNSQYLRFKSALEEHYSTISLYKEDKKVPPVYPPTDSFIALQKWFGEALETVQSKTFEAIVTARQERIERLISERNFQHFARTAARAEQPKSGEATQSLQNQNQKDPESQESRLSAQKRRTAIASTANARSLKFHINRFIKLNHSNDNGAISLVELIINLRAIVRQGVNFNCDEYKSIVSQLTPKRQMRFEQILESEAQLKFDDLVFFTTCLFEDKTDEIPSKKERIGVSRIDECSDSIVSASP